MKVSAINNYSEVIAIRKNNYVGSNIIKKQEKLDGFYKEKRYSKAIAFEGVSNGKVLQRALFHHISSLPATGSPCGQFLDIETKNFIKFLKEARQTHWIVNPLNELTEDMCPYNPLGRFSKNKYLVNLKELCKEKYGKLLEPGLWMSDPTGSDFNMSQLKGYKDKRFEVAYSKFLKLNKTHPLKKEFESFCSKNNNVWLNDYAIYNAISKKYNSVSWYDWDKKMQTAPEDAKKLREPLGGYVYRLLYPSNTKNDINTYNYNVGLYKFEQFLFDKQLKETLDDMKSQGLRMMTDFPIGVCADGVDTWINKNMFLLDKETLKPTVITGCPSQRNGKPFTQVWGHAQGDYSNPDYWNYLEESLKQLLEYSEVRLDHFAAYINRAEIPAKWVKKDGTVLEMLNIFKKEPKGMGEGFFKEEWIKTVADTTDPRPEHKGETIFDLFVRLAGDRGAKNAYMIESLGKLTETKAYKKLFSDKYGTEFTHQRVPLPKGIKNYKAITEILDNIDIEYAVSTGNHDKAALHEVLRGLLNSKSFIERFKFKRFCSKFLGLKIDKKSDIDIIHNKFMEWFYITFKDSHIHTTLMDALGLEGRYNIPGTTMTFLNRYKMETNLNSVLPFWTKILPHGFLDRVKKSGVDAGYADEKNAFIEMQSRINKMV